MPDTNPPLRFADIAAATPTREGLAAAYAALNARLDADPAGALPGCLADWDRLRRETDTWSALVHLRFAQDTTDADAKAAREYADALAPVVEGHDVAMKRRLLAMPGTAALAGAHAVRLWETDVTTFDPAIAAALEEESRLGARYTALLAERQDHARRPGGEPRRARPVRGIRRPRDPAPQAEQARWAFFAGHGAELDGLYDELVRLRHGMATHARLRQLHPARLPPHAPGGLRPGGRRALPRRGGDPRRAPGRPAAGGAAGGAWLGHAAMSGTRR